MLLLLIRGMCLACRAHRGLCCSISCWKWPIRVIKKEGNREPTMMWCYVHSVELKSIGLKFSKSRTGSDVGYSWHHNSSLFTFPIFAESWRFSVFHSLQSITPRIYRVSQEECARLREGVPYVKVYRYNPKHLCPKLNGYGDNGQRRVWSSGGSTHCTCQLTTLSMSVLECGVISRQFRSSSL